MLSKIVGHGEDSNYLAKGVLSKIVGLSLDSKDMYDGYIRRIRFPTLYSL